jgi:head-tail adaptor
MRPSSQVLIPAGSLRHQVQIQVQSTAPTLTGSPQASWTTIRCTRAAIVLAISKQASEDYQQGQFSGMVTHIVTVRWTPTPEILGGMRVLFTTSAGTHTYQVQTVDNVNLRNIRMDLMCLEINGGQ